MQNKKVQQININIEIMVVGDRRNAKRSGGSLFGIGT